MKLVNEFQNIRKHPLKMYGSAKNIKRYNFSIQRSIGNVLLIVFDDEHDTVDFPIHSFSMYE
jgi:galactose-1-phosphate uridylyltransferase